MPCLKENREIKIDKLKPDNFKLVFIYQPPTMKFCYIL